MDNKNTPVFYYDKEKAETSKSPVIIALTELQMAVLIEVIWKQHNDPNTTWCIDGLDMIHPDVAPKYKEKKFTHYVWVLSEDNVRDWLTTISKHILNRDNAFVWDKEYQIVLTVHSQDDIVRMPSINSIQGLMNFTVNHYVKTYGDPRPELIDKEHDNQE